MNANAVPKIPNTPAALAVSPPSSVTMSCGSTGMITPNATMSSSTVMKMKMNAARARVITPGLSNDSRKLRVSGPVA